MIHLRLPLHCPRPCPYFAPLPLPLPPLQDFVLFLFSTMSRTIQEIMAEAGSAEDWGTGTVLPENVCRRAMVTLENLSHVVKGEQQVGEGCQGGVSVPGCVCVCLDGAVGVWWRCY